MTGNTDRFLESQATCLRLSNILASDSFSDDCRLCPHEEKVSTAIVIAQQRTAARVIRIFLIVYFVYQILIRFSGAR